jgi:hypothetical protein
MSYSSETKKAAQDAYHDARACGHTKEEARGIRDNWKTSKPSGGNWSSNDDDYDDIIWETIESYDQDCIDD